MVSIAIEVLVFGRSFGRGPDSEEQGFGASHFWAAFISEGRVSESRPSVWLRHQFSVAAMTMVSSVMTGVGGILHRGFSHWVFTLQ
jgi:hypothetical protein